MRGLLRIHLIAAALCLLVAPILAQQVNPTIVVPQLIGRTPAQARDTLARLGLVLVVTDSTSSSAGAAAGHIVDQKPAAGTKVTRGTRVSVVVTVQRRDTVPPRQVPDVIGLNLDEATQRLAASRLKPGSTSERDQFDKPAGVVLEQKPRAGDPAPPTGTVDLLVASAWTEVPVLRGLTPDRAKVLLAGRQLQLGAARDTPVSAAAGTIVNQAPAAGTRVRKNVNVTIDVASPPVPQDTQVIVPDLTRRSLPDAIRLLQPAQLRLGNVARSDAANARAGMIAEQKPQAGTRVQRNSAVDVVIATDSTVVPALIGRSIGDARALLSRNSLSLGPIDSLSNNAAPGTVLRQNPAAQTRVPRRSAVSLTLAIPAAAPTPQQPDTTRRAVVPDLRGMTRDSAAAELKVRSLVSGAITTNPAGGRPDRVIDQSPPARSIVSAGTSVDLVFSVVQQPPEPTPVPVETVAAPTVPVTPPQTESKGFPWAIALGAGVLAAAAIGLMLRAKAARTPTPPTPIVRPPIKPKAETSAAPQLTYESVQDAAETELQTKDLTERLTLEFVGEPALQPPETELQYTTDLLQGADRE